MLDRIYYGGKNIMSKTYSLICFFNDCSQEIIKTGLTLKEAKEFCKDKESSSRTCCEPNNIEKTRLRGFWFNGFVEE